MCGRLCEGGVVLSIKQMLLSRCDGSIPILSTSEPPIMLHTQMILGAVALLSATASAKERKVDPGRSARLYETGVMHNQLMSRKMVRLIAHTLSIRGFRPQAHSQ